MRPVNYIIRPVCGRVYTKVGICLLLSLIDTKILIPIFRLDKICQFWVESIRKRGLASNQHVDEKKYWWRGNIFTVIFEERGPKNGWLVSISTTYNRAASGAWGPSLCGGKSGFRQKQSRRLQKICSEPAISLQKVWPCCGQGWKSMWAG